MQDYTEFSQLETEFIQLKHNKIGLLGGTFNPIHNGHLIMAHIALCEFMLGEIVFLPTGQPPHKKSNTIAPSEQRLDMIKLAIEDQPRYSVSMMEIERKGFTYTVDTLEILTKKNKHADYYYIIGADTLFELNTWKNFERVICLTNFICILRPGLNECDVRQYAEILNEKYGHKIFIANEKGPNISSSKIRALALQHKLRDRLVPNKIASYIEQNRVYFSED